MKKIQLFIVIILVFSYNLVNSAEKNNEIVNKISKNIRCLICQGQSIYDSNSDFAVSMKLLIENKVEDGFTENQIYDFLIDQYGQWIVYNPKLNKNTFILWLLPIFLFLIGGLIIFKKITFIK